MIRNPAFLLLLVLITSCGCPHKYRPHKNPASPPPFCVPEKIRVALVLGSGGIRGMAHAGVLQEFEEANIPIDLIVGCSAGSLVGALYSDHPSAQHVKHALDRMHSDSILDINIWKCRFGLSQGASLKRILDRNLDAENFEELKIPLVVVATDLCSGELVPIGNGDIVTAVRASCSIPFVFVPVDWNGRVLVDGGVIDPVPVDVARDLGAEIVIAVDLCELLPPTFPTNLFGVAKRSTEIAFIWQSNHCLNRADICIRPKMCGIGTFNDKMKKEIFDAGRAAAREAIPRIQALLAKSSIKDDSLPASPLQRKREVQLECYNP